MNKRGQGLPLNIIIVAIIVLVVLVVLVAIFTGRIAIFERQVGEQAPTDLIALRVTYGTCQPNANAEHTFLTASSQATDDQAKATARSSLQTVISSCKTQATQNDCLAIANCVWTG